MPLLAAWLIAPYGCSRDVVVIEEEIHGFRLGERFKDFEGRVGRRIGLKRIAAPQSDPRELVYEARRTPDNAEHIERVRLAFHEDRLMEVILYERVTTVARLDALRAQLEERYNATATSPDGTREMAYKTYWISGPGMSITLRRITKKPATKLYIQYLHDELHERLKHKAAR